MLDSTVPRGEPWRKISVRLAGPGTLVRRVWSIGLNAAPRMVRMTPLVVTTRHTPAYAGWSVGGTVAPELDRKIEVAPSTGLGKPGGATAKDLCRSRSKAGAEHPYPEEEGADVIRVPVPRADDTAPRRGVSNVQLLTLRRGVRVARTQIIPVRTSELRGPG